MAQLTIYLDETTREKAAMAAKRAKRSLSSWAREQLGAAAETGQTWPDDYFDLFGSVTDPTFQTAEASEKGEDAPREQL